jgi:galactokinase
VNLIGEHTDYNGGLCLPIALPHTTVVAATALPDRLALHSVQSPEEPFDGALSDVGPGQPKGWAAYVAGVPWVLAQQGLPAVGLRAVVDGEVPLGAGLSSSAALECSAALAVDALGGLGLGDTDEGRARLAAACIEAENVVAGAPTGGMDQAASLRCTPGHALLLDCRDGSVQQVPFDPGAAGLAVLVIDTQAPHRLVDGQYAERRDSCEAAAAALGVPTLREACELPLDEVLGRLDDPVLQRRTKHIVTEIGRVEQVVALLEAGRIGDLGPVFDESHVSMRDDFEISSPELDLAVATAQASGALGARMTGGGFGGSAIALVPLEALDTVAEQVTAAFADAGMDAPRFLVAEPSPGAVRWV